LVLWLVDRFYDKNRYWSIELSKKIYCGNLSYSVGSTQLEQIFSAYGDVMSAQVIMDRETGRSKGFGFVEMSNSQEANAAISGLNGKDNDGRSLQVNEAKPREERGSRSFESSNRGGSGGRRDRW
jgi:cold-inducible RNA-binding protein